jgi:hypothetical protein
MTDGGGWVVPDGEHGEDVLVRRLTPLAVGGGIVQVDQVWTPDEGVRTFITATPSDGLAPADARALAERLLVATANLDHERPVSPD